MSGLFRIVFSGGILPGFSLDLVHRHARERLKATPEQLVRMFSGRPLVLKKDLDEPSALSYLHKLQALGLDVTLEAAGSSRSPAVATSLQPGIPPIVRPENSPATASNLQPPPAPHRPVAEEPVAEAPGRADNLESEVGFADFARTHLNLARAEALLNGSSIEEAPVVIASPALPLPPITEQVEEPPSRSATGLTLSGNFHCPQCGHSHAVQATVLLEPRLQ